MVATLDVQLFTSNICPYPEDSATYRMRFRKEKDMNSVRNVIKVREPKLLQETTARAIMTLSFFHTEEKRS